MKKILTDIIGIAVLVALFLAFIFASYHKGRVKGRSEAIESVIFVHNTTYVYDTITRLKPVYLTSTVVDSIPYPVPVPGTTDTIYANLPRTEREYGDSTYYAVVAGVEPELKRIDIFQKTQYINNTVYVPTKDARKQFIEGDARLVWSNVPSAPLTLNYGRNFGFVDVSAGAGYDLLQRSPIVQVGTRVQFKF